jgi:regulator of RNase E activity RraB
MIDFKNIPEAKELADLLYRKLVEDGQIDFYDREIEKILWSDHVYTLRRVTAGAIQILMEKEDVERLRDEKGYYIFTFKLRR